MVLACLALKIDVGTLSGWFVSASIFLQFGRSVMAIRTSLATPLLASLLFCLPVSPVEAKDDKPDGDAKSEVALQFDLARDTQCAYIVLAEAEHPGVLRAAKDLQRDVTKITGFTPNIVHSLDEASDKCIVIGSADCAEGKALLASVGVPTDDLDGKWECFKYCVLNDAGLKQQVLAIAGSNVRGTIFGVYEFEHKHMGIDPFWFWADHEPLTRSELRYDDRINFGPTKEPTWKYRGWTLNDHPQLIEWIETGLVKRARYGRYMFSIDHQVFDRLWEAALRLKMNMFTWYFIDVDWQPDRERLQAAVDRGLFITQHQMEGVGADSGFWDHYWDNHNPAGKPDLFSYQQHPEAFREFWGYYIRRLAQFSPQVVWEVNLRGWADGRYTEPSLPDGGTDEQRARIISQAIADQAKLVREIDPNPDLEMMTTLYNEVGHYYDDGWITVPEGVTTGFSDAGMSGMSYSKRFWTEPRDPKRRYGQYFHTQYFGGGPQIAKCTNIEKYLVVNIDAMFQRGDTQHMLLAMNELRHQQIEVRAIAEMLWDYPAFQPREYLLRYCKEEFGDDVGPEVLALYDAYYEKYPHVMRDDGFKKCSLYSKVLEPLFTVIANLNNIKNGNSDGLVVNYRYNRETYEQGIRDLGDVLKQAQALLPSIPQHRRYFFTYEFIDAIRMIRGIYALSIATNDAIECLETGDRKDALAALVAVRPLVDELNEAFEHSKSTEKWQYWYRSGTNEDFYVLYNLYQKARLSLEVDSLNFVTEISPTRRPYMGNVVMHDFTKTGDIAYGPQSERLQSSMFNGAPSSITDLPLQRVFQIRGVQRVYHKWKYFVPDYDLPYSFTLRGKATVYVATQKPNELDWLAAQGFNELDNKLQIGFWGWPYRYRNRPPAKTASYAIFAKQFPAGEVALGKNLPNGHGYPYFVFVEPSLLAYENFHSTVPGCLPDGWHAEPNGGVVEVVDNPDYDAEIRPTVFDLRTVPRYTPLELQSLKLQTTSGSTDAATAELPFASPATGDFVVQYRAKAGQADRQSSFALIAEDDAAFPTVSFSEAGRITARNTKGEDTDIVPYEAGRWYNVTINVCQKTGNFTVHVEDDQLNKTSIADLPLGDSGKTPVKGCLLQHSDDRSGSWIVYDALIAYRR